MKLYPFQKKAVKKAIQAIAEGVRLLVVSAVGSGKTLIIADLVRQYFAKGGWEIVLVTPRQELIYQALSKLNASVPHNEVTILHAGSKGRGGDTIVTFGTVYSVKRRHPGNSSRKVLLLVDEAHHMAAESWVAHKKLFPNAAIVGFTATPTRLDGKPLREHFDEMYEAATPLEAADVGLTRISRIFGPSDPDLWAQAHAYFQRHRGELSKEEANSQLLKKGLVGDVVQEWLKRARDKRTLVFAASREHGHALTEQFARKRVNVGYIDGGLPLSVRNQRLADFRSGKILVMVSVELLIEGFDLPEIDCGILARPTNSLVYHMQMCGRVARNYPGAGPSILLDPVGNTLKVHLGLPEVPREWSLDGNPKIARDAQVVLCPSCGCCCSVRSVKCPDCGKPLEEDSERGGRRGRSRVPSSVEGALVELNINPQRRQELWENLTKEIKADDKCSQKEAEARAEEVLLRALGRRGVVAPADHNRRTSVLSP